MGAKQRAQKRGKSNKAPKGSLKGSPTSQRKANSALYVSDLSSSARSNALLGGQSFANGSSQPKHGFSMADEARNTERHLMGWGNTRLRDQGITFISAGRMNEGDDESESNSEQEIRDIEVQKKDSPISTPEDFEAQEPEQAEHVQLQVQSNVQSEEKSIPTTDPIIPESTPVWNDVSVLRPRSISSSSEESEQIVFQGRNPDLRNSSVALLRSVSANRKAIVEDDIEELQNTREQSAASKPIPILRSSNLATPSQVALSNERRSGPRSRRRGRRAGGRRQEDLDEEEALMQDYIANMAMDDSEEESEAHLTSKPIRKNEHFRLFTGSGEENAKVQLLSANPSTPGTSAPSGRDLDQALDWDSADLEDFDDFSTTDEEIEDIQQVLRHRHRPSGPQYLVTAVGRGTSESKWVLHKKLNSESAMSEIAIFEEMQTMEFGEKIYDEDDSSTDDSEEEALNDLIDNIESEDDENARIIEHTSRMTDEQIARALAKQEELGLGGDELMLFDGDVGNDDQYGDMDVFDRGNDFISFSTRQHTSNRTRSKKNKKRDSFPDASAFADALDQDPYGAFDIMDFDRPSLKPKKKGRKGAFPYDIDLEDEELKDQLVSTWMKDREKKADRKRAKEEARMMASYDAAERGDPAVIKAEIRRFLVQEIDVLKLAPMESHVRASVHRLAKALKLNSHSEGKENKGVGRYPVLTKTARTPPYTIDTIWEIDALLNTRKFFPRSGPGSYKTPKLPRGSGMRMRRSGGTQGATYMNGEIVGASAPELAADNRGRLLLQKMGWTTGMGIGAEGNKGSLEAIKHVVKTTKAGLG